MFGGKGATQEAESKINAADVSVPQAQGVAAQAVAQSMAILIQDSSDLFRNISTIESTAIGTATAKWLADPYNASYEQIIKSSTQVLTEVAKLVGTVGDTASKVLADFPKGSTNQ